MTVKFGTGFAMILLLVAITWAQSRTGAIGAPE